MTNQTTESNAGSSSRALFKFTGNGSEYFKIWIVNVLFTILTLGIYSAWATVRNNKYFYSNMYLDGSNFRYLADPMTILKGRIVAIIVLIIYSLVANYSPVYSMMILIPLLISMPYFYNQSLAFHMRMSAYKNIQFRFKGSYLGAVMALFVWPILGVLTLGILLPTSLQKMNEYVVNNSSYGTSSFKFSATYKDYGMILLMMIGATVLFAILGAIIGTIFALFIPVLLPVFIGFFYLIMLVFFIASTTNLFYRRLSLVDHEFDCTLTVTSYIKVILINTFLIIITLGLYAPAAKVRMVKYLSENIVMKVNGSLEDFSAAEKENVNALGEEMGQVVFDFA